MTVAELKEKLDEYPDDAVVQIIEQYCNDHYFVDLKDEHFFLTGDKDYYNYGRLVLQIH